MIIYFTNKNLNFGISSSNLFPPRKQRWTDTDSRKMPFQTITGVKKGTYYVHVFFYLFILFHACTARVRQQVAHRTDTRGIIRDHRLNFVDLVWNLHARVAVGAMELGRINTVYMQHYVCKYRADICKATHPVRFEHLPLSTIHPPPTSLRTPMTDNNLIRHVGWTRCRRFDTPANTEQNIVQRRI